MTDAHNRLAGLRRAVFARHSHPLSAWSRLATMPLMLVPLWTRRWRHAALVGAWFVVNPVIFGRPRSTRSFASRAMLGEELWMTAKPRDAALAIDAVASGLTVAASVGAWKRKPVVASVCSALSLALILEYWRRVAGIYDRSLARNGQTIDGGRERGPRMSRRGS